MSKCKKVTAAILLTACLAGSGYADRRGYVWTYEYSTMPAGIAEAEYYLTAKVPDTGARESSVWEHQAELEYGLTDNLDVGLYQVFRQSYDTNSVSQFDYAGFKARARYKLFKKDALFVDPLIYVEYIRNANLADPDVLEAKLVLARDLGSINIVYNAIVEHELGGEQETVHEFAAGTRYTAASGLSAGVETKGSYTDRKCALGPVLSYETESLWLAVGAALGVNSRTDDLQARMIIGFAF